MCACSSPFPILPSPRLKTEIVGTVGTTYKFGNLCDFQYLPVEKTEEGESSYRSIYGDVYFSKGLVDPSWLERKDGQVGTEGNTPNQY